MSMSRREMELRLEAKRRGISLEPKKEPEPKEESPEGQTLADKLYQED